MAPAAFTPSVLITVWKYILHYQIGLVNYVFDVIGVERVDFLSRSYALVTVILIAAYRSMPFVFMFVYPARTTIPKTFYESASVAGAGWWSVFRYITLPLLMPAIYVALIFRTIFTLREFAVPWLLTKGGPQKATSLLAIYLFQEGFEYNRLGSAASVSWLILIITFIIASYQIYKMYQRTFVETIAY
jgi:multiple sugar transport system permease protein